MTQTIWHLGDELETIYETIRDSQGNVVSLVSATVEFRARKVGSSTLSVSATADVISPKANGIVEYTWSTPITTAGQYLVWWVITDGANTREFGERLIEFRAHVPPGYIEMEQLKTTLSMQNETFADFDIDYAIRSASGAIDKECGRTFALDADAATVRYYTPDSTESFEIHDLVTLTSLEVDGAVDGTFSTAWVQNTNFYLEPVNAALDGEPYTRVTTRNQAPLYLPTYPNYTRTVKVTGRFGWPAVPPQITQATSILAHLLLRRAREAPFGMLALGIDTGSIMRLARNDPQVYMLISRFDRKKLMVV